MNRKGGTGRQQLTDVGHRGSQHDGGADPRVAAVGALEPDVPVPEVVARGEHVDLRRARWCGRGLLEGWVVGGTGWGFGVAACCGLRLICNYIPLLYE